MKRVEIYLGLLFDYLDVRVFDVFELDNELEEDLCRCCNFNRAQKSVMPLKDLVWPGATPLLGGMSHWF